MHHLILRGLGLLASLGLTAAAWAQPAMTVQVAGNTISGTGSAVVDLRATGGENTVTFTLTWDPAVLSYVDDAPGADLPADGRVGITRNKSQTAAGKLGVLVGLSPGLTFSAAANQILVVKFAVVGAGSASTKLAFVDTAGLPKNKVFDVKGSAIADASFVETTIVARTVGSSSTPPSAAN